MSFLPPPPLTDIPPAGAPARWSADSHAAKLTIPYLGPEPAPSRPAGTAVQILSGLAALLFAIKAGAFVWQARLEQDFLDHPTRAVADQVRSANQRVDVLNAIGFIAVVAVIVAEIFWRSQRRPKQARTERGEAYVEFPLKWVTPIALRVGWFALAVAAMIGFMLGAVNRSTVPTDYPLHHQILALANLTWAGLWIAIAVWVVLVKRSHERRVAWSAPYRADPSQVPFFPPVAGMGLFETGRGERSSAGGLGWVLRTSGLILVSFIGLLALFGGIAAISDGYLIGVPWAACGVVLLGLVTWAMVRRYQQGRL